MINKDRDAYGQMMLAHYRGQIVRETIEREDKYLEPSDVGPQNYFNGYGKWPAYEREAIKFAQGRNALDVGCGAGRVALHLQNKGLDVIAIDNSPLAIKVCKLRGVKRAVLLPIEKIGRLPRGYFDTIIMYGNNFGLFGNPKKAKNLLRVLRKISRPKSVIIACSNNRVQTTNPIHLNYQRFNRSRGRAPGQLRLRVRFMQYVGKWFDYLIVTPSEMKAIVKDTGWEVEKIIKSKKSMYAAVIRRE